MHIHGVYYRRGCHVFLVLGFCGLITWILSSSDTIHLKELFLVKVNANFKPKQITLLNTHSTTAAIKVTSIDSIETYSYLEDVRRDCGQLCNTSRPGMPGPFFNHTKAPIDCVALFKNEHIDRSHGQKHAPRKVPNHLMSDFTMNGRVKYAEWYFDQQYLGGKALKPNWTNEMVMQYISLAKRGQLRGNYGIGETNALRDGLKHAPGIKGGRVLVIGSEIPWVEACALEAGANEVVTLEYGEIQSHHSQIKTITPDAFRKSYLNSELGHFDAIVTFSSIEHSGFGRYGDALNPWGDLIAIARAWCVTKPNGSLTIGVWYDYENDYVKFNAGRMYGKIRYPYLVTNWNQLYRGNGIQRVHVFTKGKPGEKTP